MAQAPHLIDQSRGEQASGTGVDAPVQFITRPVDAEDERCDVGSSAAVGGVETGVGPPGQGVDLQGAHDAALVVGMPAPRIDGIDALEFGIQCGAALIAVAFLQARPYRHVARRAGGKPFEQGLGVERRAAGDDGQATAPMDVRHRRIRQGQPAAGITTLCHIEHIDEMVWDGRTFRRRRLGGGDVEAAIDGEGVGAHHLAPETLRQGHRQRRFAGGGGTDDDQDGDGYGALTHAGHPSPGPAVAPDRVSPAASAGVPPPGR